MCLFTDCELINSLMQPDVAINSANWKSLAEAPAEAGPSADAAQAGADGGDEVWKNFQSIAEQKQQRVRVRMTVD